MGRVRVLTAWPLGASVLSVPHSWRHVDPWKVSIPEVEREEGLRLKSTSWTVRARRSSWVSREQGHEGHWTGEGGRSGTGVLRGTVKESKSRKGKEGKDKRPDGGGAYF